MKPLELFKQETDHTCACAVAKMLLHSKGIELSEMEIEKLMGTETIKGTSPEQLIEFLIKQGFNPVLKTDSTIDELKESEGIILLLFKLHGVFPHVAIIESFSEKGVRLIDPATGFTFLSFHKLLKHWEAGEIKKGFITLKK